MTSKLREAFHEDAWIFYFDAGGALHKNLISKSFEQWALPPSSGIVGRFISVTQVGDAAAVQLSFDPASDKSLGWIDFHNLLRINGVWKITNKTAAHSSRPQPADLRTDRHLGAGVAHCPAIRAGFLPRRRLGQRGSDGGRARPLAGSTGILVLLSALPTDELVESATARPAGLFKRLKSARRRPEQASASPAANALAVARFPRFKPLRGKPTVLLGRRRHAGGVDSQQPIRSLVYECHRISAVDVHRSGTLFTRDIRSPRPRVDDSIRV
jgi:hypothetical protein